MGNTLRNEAVRDGALPESDRSTQWIIAASLVAVAIAVSWFGAPPVPALVGALGAGGALVWRRRRRS